jgi:Lon-like protease
MSQRRGWALLQAAFLPVSVAVLLAAALLVPLPVFTETPGASLSLGEAVTVETAEAEELNGDFLLTTVHLRPATVVGVLGAFLDAGTTRVPAGLVVPPGEDRDAYFERQRAVFRSSVEVAAAVGLAAAGVDVDPADISGSGALVARVLAGAPADGVLRPGDVITAVDGAEVRVDGDLRAHLQEAGAAPVELRFRRDGEERTAQLSTALLPTTAGPVRGIGVEIQTADPTVPLPFPISVEGGTIGGPSAGLMVALTVYDRVAAADLADGRVVAGTGTLTPDGAVGPIGGVALKVLAAHEAGADVFIGPGSQLATARAALPQGSTVEVIGAETFAEALAALSR